MSGWIFYWAGLGVEKNLEKAFYWTQRSAMHGDWDAQFNLRKFYEEGYSVEIDMDKASIGIRKQQCKTIQWL